MVDDRADDPSSGWEVLGLRQPWLLEQFALGLRTWGAYRPGDWICDAIARRRPDNAGTYDFRGAGRVPKRCGVVTAGEVASGDVGHSMALTGITQWGPGARFVAPATRVEHPTTAPAGYPKGLAPGSTLAVPHGTRLALDIDDADIARWARRHTGPLAETAKTLVRGLRDWGVTVLETGVGDPQIETTGTVGPDRQLWAALGVDDRTAVTLLDGLPWERLYVVAVPS